MIPLDGDGGKRMGELAVNRWSTTNVANEILTNLDREVVPPAFSTAIPIAIIITVVAPRAGSWGGGSASLTRRTWLSKKEYILCYVKQNKKIVHDRKI